MNRDFFTKVTFFRDENVAASKSSNEAWPLLATAFFLFQVEAGSIPLVGLTAWQAIVDIGKIKKGKRFSFRQVREV